ncbi:hypothetical protein ACHAP8_010349 [Fusarium lateritium]
MDLTGPYRDTHWSWVLSKYTGYDLTFEEDRLIAIAGLAKLIASKTGDSYLAGIWLESWMQDLLWEPAAGPDSKLRPEDESKLVVQQMSRPSWSWLSFPGSVMSGRMIGPSPKISLAHPNSFESKELRSLALLSENIVTPPGSDPFTSFDRTVLRIRGIGKNSTEDERLTTNEQVFDFNIEKYGLRNFASEVQFSRKVVDRLLMGEVDLVEKDWDKMVKCSLLPHFTAAEWETISLV